MKIFMIFVRTKKNFLTLTSLSFLQMTLFELSHKQHQVSGLQMTLPESNFKKYEVSGHHIAPF